MNHLSVRSLTFMALALSFETSLCTHSKISQLDLSGNWHVNEWNDETHKL
jgi:hypothetical protein